MVIINDALSKFYMMSGSKMESLGSICRIIPYLFALVYSIDKIRFNELSKRPQTDYKQKVFVHLHEWNSDKV